MVTAEQVREIALSFHGVREGGEPGRPAFDVRGRAFATLWTPRRLFVNGTLVELEAAEPAEVRELLAAAWTEAAPRAVRRAHLR